MSRANWLVGAAVACWATVTGASFAAAPERPLPPAPPTADRPAPPATADAPRATLRAKSVIGAKVSLKGGLAIGTVDDVIFDDDGYIDYLVVVNEGKDVVVPWEAAKFDFENRVATVDVAPEKFKEIPTYTAETWPKVNVYEPAYREKIYTYYGVKPRREIRIEKRP